MSGENCNKRAKIDETQKSEVKSVKKQSGGVKKGLTYSQMVCNVIMTQNELRKKRMPRFKITVKNLVKRSKKWTIDLNVNMNFNK